MKNVSKLIGIIAVVAVVGFSMAACDNGNNVLPAPTGLKAEAINTSSIKISWNHVSGAAGYYLYISKSQSSGYETRDVKSLNSVTNNELVPRTTYYYKVAAYTTDGRVGATTSAVSARTKF